MRNIRSAIGAAVLLAIAWQAAASAAAPAGNLNVTPAQLKFSLSKDASNQIRQLTITNNYGVAIAVSLQLKGIDEAAGLLIPANALEPGLGTSLHVSQTDVQLAAHQSQVISVQADNSPALAPGGHYATLVITQLASGAGQLSLQSAVSVGLFIVKEAGARTGVNLERVHTTGWLGALPDAATLTFRNTGNVLAVPRATVDVFSTNRKQLLAHGVANLQSLPVFPGKTVTVKAPLNRLTGSWLPQRLQLAITYRADGLEQTSTIRKSLWYAPPAYPAAGLLAGVLALIFFGRRRAQQRAKPSIKSLVSSLPASTESGTISQQPSHHQVTHRRPSRTGAPPGNRRSIVIKSDDQD